MNNTDKKIIKVLGIALLVGVPILGGWWYISKTRWCVSEVHYQPPREQNVVSNDKGDYYTFDEYNKFKTSEDAISACMWKKKSKAFRIY